MIRQTIGRPTPIIILFFNEIFAKASMLSPQLKSMLFVLGYQAIYESAAKSPFRRKM
jgi:hypothetical protein